MKKIACFAATVCGLFWVIGLLYLSITSFALYAGNYPSTPPYDAMAKELVAYLSGRQIALTSLFTAQEVLHMVDVLHLFQVGKVLATVLSAIGVVLFVFSYVAFGGKKTAMGIRVGMAAFVLFVLCMAVWAMISFEGWFVTMHHIAFSNDLWLFNSEESMLIQMLPLSFFIRGVRIIAFRFAVFCSILYGCTILLRITRKKNVQ